MSQESKVSDFVRWVSWSAVLALAAMVLPGCGSEKAPISAASSKYEMADERDGAQSAAASREGPATRPFETAEAPRKTPAPSEMPSFAPPAAKPPAVASEELNDHPLPKGGPEELVKFIAKLDDSLRRMSAAGPSAALSPDRLLADVERAHRAKLEAADRLLAADKLSPDFRRTACRAKLEALDGLARFQDPKAAGERKAFAEKLAQDQDAALAKLAKAALFGSRIDRLAAGEQEDPKAIVAEIQQQLASGEAGESEFNTYQDAAVRLLRIGLHEEAVQILKAVGEAFKDHKEPRLAKGAADLLEQAQILEFQILAQTALDAEFSGNTAKADQRYQLLRKNFANHKDPRLAAEAARILEKHDRRAALIGASLKIQGVLANGAAFDWTPYVGKIVLVQFWASWCGPCIAEMPNLEANYQRFRDRGFEIVGVNLDAERGAADQFLAQRPIPWATVFGDDPNASGFDDVNAVRCGVEAIPFLVLIGRDGKVLALHLRGEQLGKKLEELFASPATQPPLPGAPPTRAAPPPSRP